MGSVQKLLQPNLRLHLLIPNSRAYTIARQELEDRGWWQDLATGVCVQNQFADQRTYPGRGLYVSELALSFAAGRLRGGVSREHNDPRQDPGRRGDLASVARTPG